MRDTRHPEPLVLLTLILLVCAGAYWPGLSGDYVFDDPANILENARLAITSLDLTSLRAAFWSGDAGPLGRPLSMLSFALNHYFSGFAPFSFKLTNLLIHLINTSLVYVISSYLLPRLTGDVGERRAARGALLVAALWALHPLNLTSVLYVVQRMTSLSALFGLLALAIYLNWRTSTHQPSPARSIFAALGVLLALLLSVFSKESGILFVPLLLWIEIVLLRGRRAGAEVRIGRIKLLTLAWVLVLLGLIAVVTMLPALTDPANFIKRGFTLQERLLTEARVLFYYLRLLFCPTLSELSLYHDDFIVSTGLLQPADTLLSVLGLTAISLICALVARKDKIWLFAWGWFLVSQVLESSVISLELVHEHRNYFATIGPLILVPVLIERIRAVRLRRAAQLAGAGVCLLLAFLTWQRSMIWSNLVDQAAFEAASHPDSDRANYQLARVYLKLLDQRRGEKYAELAEQALLRAGRSYRASNGSLFGRIHLAYYLKRQPDPALVENLRQNLRREPLQNSNIGFLEAFVSCQISSHCHMPHDQAVSLLVAALENPTGNRLTRSCIDRMLARYFSEVAGDYAKGIEFARDALAEIDEPNGHYLLAQIYRLDGKYDAAVLELERIAILDKQGLWVKDVLGEQRKIAEERKKVKAGIEKRG